MGKEDKLITRRDLFRGILGGALALGAMAGGSAGEANQRLEKGKDKEEEPNLKFVITGRVVDSEGRGIGGAESIPAVMQRVPTSLSPEDYWELWPGALRPDGENVRISLVREQEDGREEISQGLSGMGGPESGSFVLNVQISDKGTKEESLRDFFSQGDSYHLELQRYGLKPRLIEVRSERMTPPSEYTESSFCGNIDAGVIMLERNPEENEPLTAPSLLTRE